MLGTPGDNLAAMRLTGEFLIVMWTLLAIALTASVVGIRRHLARLKDSEFDGGYSSGPDRE